MGPPLAKGTPAASPRRYRKPHRLRHRHATVPPSSAGYDMSKAGAVRLVNQAATEMTAFASGAPCPP